MGFLVDTAGRLSCTEIDTDNQLEKWAEPSCREPEIALLKEA